jgi:hypothetical protein
MLFIIITNYASIYINASNKERERGEGFHLTRFSVAKVMCNVCSRRIKYGSGALVE